MNNQIFDFNRFSTYFKKYLVEKRSSFLVCLGMFLLFPLLFCLGWPYMKGYYTPQAVEHFVVRGNVTDPMWYSELTLFLVMWLVASVFCYLFYAELTKKRERIALFTCPASNFEKFATSFIIFVILFPILAFLFILFADAIRVWVYGASSEGLNYVHYISPRYLLSFGCDMKYFDLDFYGGSMSPEQRASMMEYFKIMGAVKFSICLFGGLLSQALFALGSCVWPKNSFVKTGCFLMAFGMASSILFYWGIKVFYGGDFHLEPRSLGLENELAHVVLWDCVAVGIIIFTWLVSYFRFKEWEVIKRW